MNSDKFSDYDIIEQLNDNDKKKQLQGDNLDLTGGKYRNFNITPVTQFYHPKQSVPFAQTGSYYTIPKGVILYHGTKSYDTFDPYNIKLGNINLVAFFSPQAEWASSHMSNCITSSGYIHAFKVKKSIDKILILSPYSLKNKWTLDNIEYNYCDGNSGLNGVGFFIKDNVPIVDIDPYSSEFALCNPDEFLDYMYSKRCIIPRTLSKVYDFLN